MPVSKPSTYLNWVPSGSPSYITQPSSGKQTTGWLAAEKPTFQNFNWMFYTVDQWIQYFDQLTLGLKGQYEAIVGGVGVNGATHATLALALADSAVPAGARILLGDSQTLSAAVQVNKNYIRITALPGVTYTAANGSAVLQINASRVVVENLRFANFTTAIQVQASGIYAQIRNNWFNTCTLELDDTLAPAGQKPAAYGNVSE